MLYFYLFYFFVVLDVLEKPFVFWYSSKMGCETKYKYVEARG